MSTATEMLEERTETVPTEIKICDLKGVADRDVAYHPEKKLLAPRWEVCIRCGRYETSCPGYR